MDAANDTAWPHITEVTRYNMEFISALWWLYWVDLWETTDRRKATALHVRRQLAARLAVWVPTSDYRKRKQCDTRPPEGSSKYHFFSNTMIQELRFVTEYIFSHTLTQILGLSDISHFYVQSGYKMYHYINIFAFLFVCLIRQHFPRNASYRRRKLSAVVWAFARAHTVDSQSHVSGMRTPSFSLDLYHKHILIHVEAFLRLIARPYRHRASGAAG